MHVDSRNEQEVFYRLYKNINVERKKPRFKIDDQVRISRSDDIFTKKSNTKKWSEEVFKISEIKLTYPVMYYLSDYNNERILGGFYEQELLKVKKNKEDLWDIERIIKKRKINGKTEYLVKFRGYKDHTWVSQIIKK